MPIFIFNKDEDRFHQIASILLLKIDNISYASNTLCRKKIGDEFTTDAINNADFLLVNLFDEEQMVGFATMKYFDTKDDKYGKYLYINLICNQLGYHLGLNRWGMIHETTQMIKDIEYLAKQMGCQYVIINSINDVFTNNFENLGYNPVKETDENKFNIREGNGIPEETDETKVNIGEGNGIPEETDEKKVNIQEGIGILMIKKIEPVYTVEGTVLPTNNGGKKTKKRRYKSKSKKNKRKSKARKQRKNKTKRHKSKK